MILIEKNKAQRSEMLLFSEECLTKKRYKEMSLRKSLIPEIDSEKVLSKKRIRYIEGNLNE